MPDGWVKLYRALLEWPWFRVPGVAHFWIYCLLKATHTDRTATVGMDSVSLEPGQFVFGRNQASKETGLSVQNIRTALEILTKRAECLKITTHSTNHFSVVTVLNWETYQERDGGINQPVNQPPTNRQPGSNQPPTTDKNVKNGKKGKKEEEDSSEPPQTADPEPPSPLTFPDFPCVGGGPAIWTLTTAKVAEYASSFPGVNLDAELRKAWQWCVDNRANRKTFRGMPAFLSRWLSRAQDQARAPRRQGVIDFDAERREQQRAEKQKMLDDVFADPPEGAPSGT